MNYPSDARFEEAAYQEAARFEKQPIEKIRALSHPITITYSREKCVELRPRAGVAGGHMIYCFDSQSGHLLRTEQVGQ